MGICIEKINIARSLTKSQNVRQNQGKMLSRQNVMIHRIFMWRYIYPFNINTVYNNYRMPTSINNQIKYCSRDALFCIVFNDL